MIQVLQHVLDAVSVGSIYALFALGIALIYGVARIVNFAQGEFMMIVGYVLLVTAGLGWPLQVMLAIVAGAALALLAERTAFRAVRGADETTVLIVAFGVAVFLQNFIIVTAGARARGTSFGSGLAQSLDVGGLRVPRLDIVIITVVAVVLIALTLFLRRTTKGLELRAAAEDFGMARLLGVRANGVISWAFAISGVLAGITGVLLVAQGGTLHYGMGTQPVLIAFIATVIGGLGSLSGAVIGAYLLGAVTVLLSVTLPGHLTPYRDSIVFGLVIALLLLRPEGLMRVQTRERV
jgi:branched-chain amino acid transport system permease protein